MAGRGVAGISRRQMLAASGRLGAGAAAPGGTALGAGAAKAAAGTAPGGAAVPATADLPLIGGAEFPIGAFWPPPPHEITAARYQEVADAGFTFLVNGNYLWDATGIGYALNLAGQAGLKVLVTGDPLLSALTGNFWPAGDPTGYRPQISAADAAVSLRAVLDTYRGFSSFAGLALSDEPAANRFGALGSLVGLLRQITPAALPYVNFRRIGQPYGPWGTPGMDVGQYTDYLRQAVDTVAPSLLSFDRYPLGADGTDDPGYFQNWAVVREAGLRANLPTWIYVQSLGYAGHRLPTAAELGWQVNVSLAYGAKGVQYFTYWTPDLSRGSGFASASGLITVAGERTALYEAAKRLNTRWLRPVGRELKPLVSTSVVHANDTPLPVGATAFTPDDRVAAATGGPVVLGTFARPDASRSPAPADRTRWLLAVNRSHTARAAVRLSLRPDNVTGVAVFDPATGTYRPRRDPGSITVDLAPGAAALHRLTAD